MNSAEGSSEAAHSRTLLMESFLWRMADQHARRLIHRHTELLVDLCKELGMSVLFITHDLNLGYYISDSMIM